jgi:hypothetical protein
VSESAQCVKDPHNADPVFQKDAFQVVSDATVFPQHFLTMPTHANVGAMCEIRTAAAKKEPKDGRVKKLAVPFQQVFVKMFYGRECQLNMFLLHHFQLIQEVKAPLEFYGKRTRCLAQKGGLIELLLGLDHSHLMPEHVVESSRYTSQLRIMRSMFYILMGEVAPKLSCCNEMEASKRSESEACKRQRREECMKLVEKPRQEALKNTHKLPRKLWENKKEKKIIGKCAAEASLVFSLCSSD